MVRGCRVLAEGLRGRRRFRVASSRKGDTTRLAVDLQLSPHDEGTGDHVVKAAFAVCECDHRESDAEQERGKNLCEVPTDRPAE